MSAAPIPLHGCKHAEVDVEALLADDRIAAAVAAPVVPGTTEHDIQRWMVCVYRHLAGRDASPAAVCVLLQQRNPGLKHTCVLAKAAWKNTEEYAPVLSKADDWLADPRAALPQESTTDVGNARRLAVLSGTDIAHDTTAGWRIWAGSAWIGDPDGTVVQRAAKGVARMIESEADALRGLLNAPGNEAHQEHIRDRLVETAKAAHSAEQAKRIGYMTKLVRDEPGVLTRADQWNANKQLIACPGITVELTHTGHTTHKPRRADRITKLTRGRPGTGAKAPLWEAFMRSAQPSHEVRLYVQRLLGYGLISGNPRRLFVIFLGKTSTGKTTVGEIINHVLGNYAGPFNLSLFRGKMDEGPRADVIKALDRRMIFASEVSQRWQLHADEVKRLTGGGDAAQARDLYTKASAIVEQQPEFLPILSANHVPAILGADPATRGRLLAVPWEHQVDPDHQDLELGEKIRTQEADGVFDWLLHGHAQYQRYGLEQPLAVVQATMKLHDSLTVQDHWLAEHTEKDESYAVTSDALWSEFMQWCKDSGIPDEIRGTKIGFTRCLRDHGYIPAKVDGQRGWKGLRLGQSQFADHGS